ncbi:hypothetical protein FHS83_003390 [Rhizomicrobium palustre]|uniref:Uncharacterized protein n=1 Tax=Rhizomicrobium palustre TaxID=189966 RepID=A0A846N4F3_9PROT|nr:hypothetical protein [Rhizomicrobium palustre]NIK90072.1 hypothetical protein [Rhizomicrobium palustre]
MPIRPRSTFAAAADQLQRLVHDIKQQQYEATGLRQRPLLPEDAPVWRRAIAVRSPKSSSPGTLPLERSNLAPLASFAVDIQRRGMPKKPVFRDNSGPEQQSLSEPVKTAAGTRHTGDYIGAGLGKPGPKRGLFNRLFRRDN